MSDDKTFDLLVSRTLTRETSTLAILIVSASASLILLPLFCQSGSELKWLFGIMAITFPILGILFREVTYRTIQEDDYNEIRQRVKDLNDYEIIRNRHGNKARRVLFYFITFLPIIGWIIILSGMMSSNGC